VNPDDEKTDDLTPPTPEELAELRQAKTELDALKPELAKFTLKDGDKAETVDLSTADGRKRAAELGSGGFHLAQKAEKLNQANAALDAKVKEQVEAEIAKRQPKDIKTGEPVEVDVDKLIADTPALAKAVEDGEPEAFNRELAKVLKVVLKARPATKPEQPTGGVSEERLEARAQEMQAATEQAVIFKTKVRPDSRFRALAEKLAKVYHCSVVEAETRIVADFKAKQAENPDAFGDMSDDAAILDKVVAPWLVELGIKVGAASSEGRGEGKEDAPDGSLPSGGGPGGPGPRRFQSELEVDKYLEETRKAKKPGTGKWQP